MPSCAHKWLASTPPDKDLMVHEIALSTAAWIAYERGYF